MNYLRTCGFVLALATAGNVVASEPASRDGATARVDGMKAAVDPATGRLRPLTEEESALLDATTVVTPARARAASVSGYSIVMPHSDEDALASARTLPSGATVMKAPPSAMSTLVARRDAQGRIVVSHEGDAPQVREVASE
ncbi:hypothetical protein [Lysobacter sp. N42]|jgi:hypothetical protein|uniref:post-PEP-CTERM-1 domain-containing protein n=1 Tax=Lysobacter sp. N42 TaxID=2545719 RepID=UPI00104A1DEB|nr:hypothetical protein [Lysobacter sp. N42]TCZ84235.1 hypothetical protein EYQ95_20495 [Lysobacter sp. N42]